MKKSVRILAMFMAAVVLLSSMAISAFAASAVSSVDIDIDIAPGVNATDYDEYFTINTPGVSVSDYFSDYDFIIYDDYGNYVTDKFEIGNGYNVEFLLKVNPGYTWPSSEFEFSGVVINDEYANYYFYYDESIDATFVEVSYYTELTGPISDVDLTVDVYGEMSESMYDRYITVNSSGLYYYYGNFDAVNAYDAEGNDVESFVAGEDYTIEMFFEPRTECYFEKDESGNFVMNSVTVNGEAAEYYVGSYNVNGYYEYIKVVAKVTAKTAKFIKEVSFDIDTDLDGVKVEDWEDYITIKTEGLKFENYLDDPAVYAYNSFDELVDTFRKGEVYELYIYFTPEEGYFFPFDEYVESVTVNGTEYYDSYYFDYYTAADGTDIYYICFEMSVDMSGNFFDQIIYFFRTLFDIIRSFFTELFVW